jgi:hypothetical protein
VEGATGYDLYFGENVVEPLEKIGDNLPSPSMPFPELEIGKVYYWHMVAHTIGGDIQGPYWWFQVSDVPDISVNPVSINFGSVNVCSTSVPQTITISNTCTADLVIGTITPTGTNASEFRKQNDNCSGQTIAPSGTCTVDVRFSPKSGTPEKFSMVEYFKQAMSLLTPGAYKQSKSAILNIPSNDPDMPILEVPLSGKGYSTMMQRILDLQKFWQRSLFPSAGK